MTVELLATCWTHAGDAVPIPGRHLSPVDLRMRAEAVAAAGFTGIGVTIGDLEASPQDLREVARMLDDLGLVHREVELLENWWTGGQRRQESDRTRHSLLAAAGILGARHIKIGPDCEPVDGVVPPLTDVDRWAAELHDLAGEAAEVGARVAIEPLPFSNLTDFRLAADLVAAADHPAAGLVVDIWHLEFGPSTLADLATVPGGKVFVVELDDAPALVSTDLFAETINRRVLLGDGGFDVAGFITTLQRSGFDGPWGVEIISEAHRGRPLDQALADARRTTTAMFERIAAT